MKDQLFTDDSNDFQAAVFNLKVGKTYKGIFITKM